MACIRQSAFTLLLAASGLCLAAAGARATAVQYRCEVGSFLSVEYTDGSAEVRLADGTELSLPEQPAASGFWYASGRHELRGKGDEVRFSIGRRTPIACHGESTTGRLFDVPRAESVALAAGETGFDMPGRLRCRHYADFALKELDLGEKGAAALFIAPASAGCKLGEPGDRQVEDDTAGYLWGAKGPYVFFKGADGWNGGLPFVVYDAQTGNRLFDDVMAGDDIEAAEVSDTEAVLQYRRVYAAECSLLAAPESCSTEIRKALDLAADRAMPDCRPAYQPLIDADPASSATIKAWPNVIEYPVSRKVAAGGTTLSARAGGLACRASE